ncbi:hypothetical protein [Agrobacterium larrymoorei]|uniref:Uncharacterized protein involved in exopolysaccharide biosynthesis n=1 Tax=Agrobacterium larrymoorei TaxID=160699 RepID=A0ABU0UJI4_9HYPH|nr:hypothetical protein [Agrobacterium larrymoorei]MDQ1185094.1 uncharacterized protein involved in exopolysaccharide biosynthesis [Agrobacterium larrymoorei]
MALHTERHVGSVTQQPATGKWRRFGVSAAFVVTFAGVGALLPSAFIPAPYTGYVSHAVVRVSASSGNPVDTGRVAASMQQSLLSPVSLTLAISELKLKAGDVTGIAGEGRLAMLANLLLGDVQPTTPVNAIEDALRQSVKITSASKTDIDVGVTAATPKAAERIVDYLARQVVKGVGGDHAEPALQAVEKARTALDAAEGALTGFQMRHGNDIVSRIQGLQQSLHEADARIAALSEKEHDLAQAVTKVSAMKTNDVLTKALPPLPVFEALAPVRDTYTTAKLALDDVNVDHGPKHPRTIAAQGAVDAARSAAMPALRRALDGAKAELKDVAATLGAETREKAAVEEQLRAMGDAPEELAKLEKALETARRDYLAASEKAGPFAAPTVTAAIVKSASPAVLQEEGIFPQMMLGLMAAGGALVGVLLALFLMSFRRTETEDRVGPAIQMAIEAEAAVEAAPAKAEAHNDRFDIEPDIFHDLVEDDVEPVYASAHDDVTGDDTWEYDLHDEPANDIPLDERVRQVLLANRVRYAEPAQEQDGFRLPPLLAAALEGKADHAQAETDEIRALRQELALLRQRLNGFVEDDMRRRG